MHMSNATFCHIQDSNTLALKNLHEDLHLTDVLIVDGRFVGGRRCNNSFRLFVVVNIETDYQIA